MTLHSTGTANPLREYKGTLSVTLPYIANLSMPAMIRSHSVSTQQQQRGYCAVNDYIMVETLSDLKFQLKCEICIYQSRCIVHTFIRFWNKKNCNIAGTRYDINIDLKINELDPITQRLTLTDKVDTTWHLLSKQDINTYAQSQSATIAVSVVVDKTTAFSALHNDTSLIDFELHGENGFIPVHRTVLAMSSPMVKAFFENETNCFENRCYKFSKTDISTLQHLKDYIYLGNFPEEGIEKLALVASCCKMKDLENECIEKILQTVTPQNALKISTFAVVNKMTDLYLGFLRKVENGKVKVAEIPKPSTEQ